MKENLINKINSFLELEVLKKTYQDLIPEKLLSKKININIEDISFDISLIFEKAIQRIGGFYIATDIDF